MANGPTVLRLFLRWYLPLAALIVATALFIGGFHLEHFTRNAQTSEWTQVKLAQQTWEEVFPRWRQHLLSLATQEAGVRRGLNQPNDLPILANAFMTLLHRNPEYTRVRWVGEDGRERLSVRRLPDGQIIIVPASQLENKRGRYYFSQILGLAPDEVYVSPIDLEVDQGQVAHPYRPALRIGLLLKRPDGTRNGMLLLNIDPARLFEQIAGHNSGSAFHMLDADGYWLKSSNPADEWGALFNRGKNFATSHPELWKAIRDGKSGQDISEQGIWTWTSLETRAAPEGSITAREWKLVFFKSRQAYMPEVHRFWLITGIVGCLLLLMFGLGVWNLARETITRRGLEQGLRMRNIELDASVRQHLMTLNSLEQSLARLEAADRLKHEFLSTISHELLTPLNGIMGMADLARMSCQDPEQAEFLDTLRASANRLHDLIQRILAYLELSAGRVSPDLQPFDVRECVEQALSSHATQAQRKGLMLGSDFAADVPEAATGSPALLRAVMKELLDNAIAFTRAGSIRVGVTRAAESEGAGKLHFSVEDSGCGMTPEAIECALEPLRQVDGSLTRKHGGIGLGLALTQKRVALMGGRLWVDSTLGSGSTFHFTMAG